MQNPSKNQIVKALERAKAKIEAGWTKGTCARDAEGNEVDPTSRKACEFCAFGAVFASTKSHPIQLAAHDALDAAATKLANRGIVSFNDTPRRRKTSVLKAFDLAIEKVKAS